jgi:hypothetical protein
MPQLRGNEPILGLNKTGGYTYGYQPEEGCHFRFKVGGSKDIQVVDRVLDVFGQHQDRYMFFCEYLESFHGGAEVGALDSIEACSQVLERYNGVWIEIFWR